MTDQILPRLIAEQEIEVRNLLKRIDEINAESAPLGLAISVFKAQNGHYPSDDLDHYETLIDERETLMQYRAFEYVAPMLSEIAALRAELDAANERAANAERERDALREQLTPKGMTMNEIREKYFPNRDIDDLNKPLTTID